MKIFKNLRLADPFLVPNWRHERVVQMFSKERPERCRPYDDEWIRAYRSFLLEWKRDKIDRLQLLHSNPGIYYAYSIYEKAHLDPEVALILEARLLSGCRFEDIAHDLKTVPEAVVWYEKLFFNVSDFLTHHDWILRRVLLPASDRDAEIRKKDKNGKDMSPVLVKPHLDLSLKFLSYFGGPLVCDFVISGFRRNSRVKDPAQLGEYLDEQFQMHIKRRSTQAAAIFEINKYNVTELFSIHTRLLEIQKSSKNQEDRHTDIEQSISGLLHEFRWYVGDRGMKAYGDKIIGHYDNTGLELEQEEALAKGSGQKLAYEQDLIDAENVFENRRESVHVAKP